MNFEDLLEGIKYYNDKYPHWNISYDDWRKKGDDYWLHLEKLDESQLKNQVLSFLNKWLCRASYNSTPALKLALERSASLYLALQNESLITIDFNATKNIGGQSLSNAEIIKKIMSNLLDVQPKFGPVPASKLMHMAIPDLFIMWDKNIKKQYGIPDYYSSNHAVWYVKFLNMMQIQINHVTTDYARIHNVSNQDAIPQIMEHDNNLTIPRILDKYNFGIRDGKLQICNQCFKR